jgi:hypothetical protein
VKARNDAEKEEATRLKQGSLDPHLAKLGEKERVLPYTDALFRQAAIDWLVATDQVCVSMHHCIELLFTGSTYSRSKHLSIPSFRRWSILQPEQQMVSKSPVEKRLERKLSTHSKKIYRTFETS